MAEFKTIHTTAGLIAMSQAAATGTPVNLTHMAVGDGAGNAVEPNVNQTTLVREMYRGAINRVYRHISDPTRFVVEMAVPATAGGFTTREAIIYNASGVAFVTSSLSPSYIPSLGEGATADVLVRIEFVASNADVITLQIDPNVAMASQQWVISNVTAATVIPGGTTGQKLIKESNIDGDYKWADEDAAANVVIEPIEEKQTLASGQTIVNLAITTTHGLAVYINGERLANDQWTADPLEETRLTLASSYPENTVFLGVQNEPAGAAAPRLLKYQNLADLDDVEEARHNLGVFSKDDVRQLVPPGIIDHYAGLTPPPGWLVRDGSAISRTAYSQLYSVLGDRFGAGDGFNTFNLPDDRENFDRGWGGPSSGKALGSFQSSSSNALAQFESARNPAGENNASGVENVPANGGWSGWRVTGRSRDGDDHHIRMRNIGVTDPAPRHRYYLPIIKY